MSKTTHIPALTQEELAANIGVAKAEINPPAEMYARTWGSSQHDIAEGIHRPLRASCIAIEPIDGGAPLYFISLDLMVWLSREDEALIGKPLEKALGIKSGRLIVQLSHSHGAPFTDPTIKNSSGSNLISQYREEVFQACINVCISARENMVPSMLSWGVGKCGLAYDRDLPLPETGEIICGVNPTVVVTDTLVVARVSDAQGKTYATLVHYAAHPTSVGGGNRLISPDYIGAMRELVERETEGAICIFLHGADGDLTPRRSFEDCVDAADQNGKELGYAALSTLAGLFPAGKRMVFDRKLESGATLGLWKFENFSPDKSIAHKLDYVSLKIGDIPSLDQCCADFENAPSGFKKERAQRRFALRRKLGDGPFFDLPIYVWKLGQVFIIGAPVEFYSDVQKSLSDEFLNHNILVLNICNGFLNYLPRQEDFDRDTYPVRISLFAKGSMEKAIDRAKEIIREMI